MQKKSWFYYSFWLASFAFVTIMTFSVYFALRRPAKMREVDAGQLQKMRYVLNKTELDNIK